MHDVLAPAHTRHTQVEELVHTPIRQVFAGSVHTCVLTRAGHVFSFGKHEYTGHGCHEDVLLPRLLDDFEGRTVTQISVGPGGYHTIALTTDKEVRALPQCCFPWLVRWGRPRPR